MNVIVKDLEFKFEEIQSENDPTAFYIKVADYGKYLLDNEIVEPFLKSLQKESEADVGKYKTSCEKFITKWEELTSDLLKRASKEGVTDSDQNPLENQISELTAEMGEELNYDDDYVSRRYSTYIELLKRFVEKDGIGRFIPKHIVLNSDDEKSYVLFTFYEQTQIEWRKFKEVRKIKTWWAHCQIMRLTHGVLDLEDKNHYFSNNRVMGLLYRHEFDLISKGYADSLVFLKKYKFLEWIKILHNYLIPRLSSTEKDEGKEFGMERASKWVDKLPNKREMAKEVTRLIKVCGLGKKEAKLLKILSNFELKRTRELTSEIPTKDYKHLKSALTKKISREGWVIKTNKGQGLNPNSFYSLVKTTPADN